ncbi:type ISP restriction/modification enzyme [Leptospira idonii]|uniref:site-specific DNA-methyltransferase (adenine-specific) n=1 Tax=Leptospira idonii TaxID=1193500 RepID=A0A4R9M121_9LEPT|nr:type ISP restriction/modification enzyme [Leptospira idonii]TGN20434.1 DNA methyltransferase [Leptospira idonii]
MPIQEYVKQIQHRLTFGVATEHSYRGDLQSLLSQLVEGIVITNEPKRQKCGAPDYIIHRKEVPLGYIEAKNIGIDLDKAEKSEQLKRYLRSLDNLILSDYLEFRFYRSGQKVKRIKLASLERGNLKVHSENFKNFETHIQSFCNFQGQTIDSAEKLAKMMAQKAKMMEEVLYNALKEEDPNNSLRDQFYAFRKILIHDLDEKTFSDIYAQTIAYGLFAARLNDGNGNDFSRLEARELISKSNPFLRNLFDYISGVQLDERVSWIVDDLADIFRATNLHSILSDFGKATAQNDPFLHFYETFLSAYDPKLRRSRGVYYTPEPVVNFIVRAVDEVLKDEFSLEKGLAENRKITIKYNSDEPDKRSKTGYKQIDKEVHQLQILDPATGTGTFLSETIKLIHKRFQGQEGAWSSYVEEDLIPRINGFEILMASYTMCHLKVERLLKETGYRPKDEKSQNRLKVYLTNTLEEAHPDTGTLFASWLSRESTEANYLKRDTPVMVVIGNPPYSVSSANKSKWIEGLLTDYKKDLNEKNINPLSDDYLKFIRFGQHFIDKNGEGILAYISNNSFIDGLIHRQARKNILESFNKIYILDLHGNSNRQEKTLKGDKDENVFDIKQGVSINIFIKKKRSERTKIYHYDCFGKRKDKYDFLRKNGLKSIGWKNINAKAPYFFFVPNETSHLTDYKGYFPLNRIFLTINSGIKTHRDHFIIDKSKKNLETRIRSFFEKMEHSKYPSEVLEDFKLVENVYFNHSKFKEDSFDSSLIKKITYRPFDDRYIYYSTKLIDRHRSDIMENMLEGDNFGLCLMRQYSYGCDYCYTLLSKNMIESRVFVSNKGMASFAPLYIREKGEVSLLDSKQSRRTHNLSSEFIRDVESEIKIPFRDTERNDKSFFSALDLLDYIYSILHSPSYRKKYIDLLKIDFPRIPLPKDTKSFWELVSIGSQLRKIHLFENSNPLITTFSVSGDNSVDLIEFKDGKVWINEFQYFDHVPESAWNFFIGGYQPAQKWLKDRKGETLNSEELFHYQNLIVCLKESDDWMQKVDEVLEMNSMII